MARLTKTQKAKLNFIDETVNKFIEEQNKQRPEIEIKMIDDATKLIALYVDAGYNIITVASILANISSKIAEKSITEWRKSFMPDENLGE